MSPCKTFMYLSLYLNGHELQSSVILTCFIFHPIIAWLPQVSEMNLLEEVPRHVDWSFSLGFCDTSESFVKSSTR